MPGMTRTVSADTTAARPRLIDKKRTRALGTRPSNISLLRQLSNDADVRRSVFACLTVLSDVKTYTHSLMKRLLSRNRTDVHKNIIAAVIRLDKAKAFVVLEQLNNSSSQVGSPLSS